MLGEVEAQLCHGMCLCRAKRNLEEHFPHQNWVIVIAFQLLLSTIFSVMNPSIYQFVTSPPSIPEELKNDKDSSRFWPGLGGSDTDYAWVLVSQPIFEVATIPLTVAALHRLPFSFVLYIFAVLTALGGATYALANSVWIAFVGRGLIGSGVSFGASTLHTYLGEMGTVMDDIREKQGKNPRKYVLYIALSFTINGGTVIPTILNSIMANFKDLNPYRWPGWSITALSITLALIVLFFFTETRSISCAKISRMSCSCLKGFKLSAQLKGKWKIRLLSYVFVISCGYMVGQMFSILYTLVTPVLSDQFGFNVEYTSHFLIGLTVASLGSSVIHLGAKVAKMDNRNLLGLSLVFALVGSVLIGDWQSIGNDPCSSASLNTTTTSDFENDFSEHIRETELPFMASGLSSGTGENISEISLYEQLVEDCEAQSSSGHQCFWNPQSRVTGEFCNTCLPVCLSKQTTINFYQFTAGTLLLSVAPPLGLVFVSAITSDITSVESQGAVMSLLMGSGAISRVISPFWFVESYELTDRHTYFAMAIIAGCALVLLLSLVALYKKLAPISQHRDENGIVNATSKLSLAVMENGFPATDPDGTQPAASLDEDIDTKLQDTVWNETPL